jgi:hypothetical protein
MKVGNKIYFNILRRKRQFSTPLVAAMPRWALRKKQRNVWKIKEENKKITKYLLADCPGRGFPREEN